MSKQTTSKKPGFLDGLADVFKHIVCMSPGTKLDQAHYQKNTSFNSNDLKSEFQRAFTPNDKEPVVPIRLNTPLSSIDFSKKGFFIRSKEKDKVCATEDIYKIVKAASHVSRSAEKPKKFRLTIKKNGQPKPVEEFTPENYESLSKAYYAARIQGVTLANEDDVRKILLQAPEAVKDRVLQGRVDWNAYEACKIKDTSAQKSKTWLDENVQAQPPVYGDEKTTTEELVKNDVFVQHAFSQNFLTDRRAIMYALHEAIHKKQTLEQEFANILGRTAEGKVDLLQISKLNRADLEALYQLAEIKKTDIEKAYNKIEKEISKGELADGSTIKRIKDAFINSIAGNSYKIWKILYPLKKLRVNAEDIVSQKSSYESKDIDKQANEQASKTKKPVQEEKEKIIEAKKEKEKIFALNFFKLKSNFNEIAQAFEESGVTHDLTGERIRRLYKCFEDQFNGIKFTYPKPPVA